MNKIKEQIDRELNSFTFDSIDRTRLEEKLSHRRKDKHMKLNKKLITGIAAAVAGVTVLTVSVGAATGWDYGRLIRGFYGREDIGQNEADAMNKLENLIQDIPDNSGTNDVKGVYSNTFTKYDAKFDGIVSDGKVLMASVTLKSKDGTPFIAEEDGRNSRYSGFFRVEGIENQGGSEWWRVREDGSLQCMCIYNDVNITEKTKIKISYNYLLCDASVLKYCDVSEIDPDEVLDPGVLTAEIELDVNEDYKDFELKNADGKVMNAHITPISLEITYDPSILADGSEKTLPDRPVQLDEVANDKDNSSDNNTEDFVEFDELPSDLMDRVSPTDIVIYDKDGNELVGSYDYTGSSGTHTDEETGMASYYGTFAKVIDVDEVGSIVCRDFTSGEVPDSDTDTPKGVYENTFTNYDASFDGIICDGKSLNVMVTLKNKDGTPFDKNNYYSGFFTIEGTDTYGGRHGVSVREDGTLQCICSYNVDITEKTKVKISYNYLLCNSDELKYQDVSEFNPDEVLDPGVISAEVELDVCEDYKDLELKNADGKVINVHVTPISVELTYEPGTVFADGTNMLHTSDFVIYGKDGEILINNTICHGGTGDETGWLRGVAYYYSTFAKVIDVDDIAGMTCKEYSFGEIPG